MTQDSIPEIALSVRQPWAWAIIHAGKDIENRTAAAVRYMAGRRGRIAIHASKGMTREEYESAVDFMASIGVTVPQPSDLLRGGIFGSVEVTGIVDESESRWFFGPRGLTLRDPRPCKFIPARGALGFFRWSPSDPPIVPPLAKWMLPDLPKVAGDIEASAHNQIGLFR